MSLVTPERIRTLQRALYMNAKQEPTRRFHVLYDKVWRKDILAHAYARCPANGALGVDGVTFSRIDVYGVERWLDELREEVRTGRYKPQPVRLVIIPKSGGIGQRPLGIPTIGDRVVQTAATLVLERISQADFDEQAYGLPQTACARCGSLLANIYMNRYIKAFRNYRLDRRYATRCWWLR